MVNRFRLINGSEFMGYFYFLQTSALNLYTEPLIFVLATVYFILGVNDLRLTVMLFLAYEEEVCF